MASGPSIPSSGLDRAAAMSELLAQNWWVVALRGVFAVIFAILTFAVPMATLLTLVYFFAAYMVVDGVCGIVAAARAARQNQRWGLLVLEGVVDILVGITASLWPGVTLLFFVSLIAFWSLVTGVLMIVAAFKLHAVYGRGWLIFSGIVSLLFGVALLLRPGIAAEVLALWLGAYAMVFGIGLIVLAFKLKARKDSPAPVAAGRT